MVSIFSQPLATPAQLSTSPSQLAGIPESLEQKVRLAASRLIQAAGVLLELPQPTISTSILLLQRFYLTTSILTTPLLQTSLATLYLSCKLTEQPKKPRDLINIFKYLLSPASPLHPPSLQKSDTANASLKDGYYVSEGDYTALRAMMLNTEAAVLRSLGFNTTVHLPYTLAFNYLQSLGVLQHTSPTQPTSSGEEPFQPLQHAKLISTTFAYLTDLLISPSQPYLTHHPHELAVVGIYLAARDHGVKLPERWWEVWDVERETLGFLVVVGRGGTYTGVLGGKGKLWIVEEGKFEDVKGEDGEVLGEVVAVGRESIEREVRRLRDA
ncbi:Cyclin-L2 [Dactylella cylindrospora]|nr:Cyclin-L2 [Dactylella cylindrospora]